ncbi:hypothetical protein [Clostridium thermopalmarium]|jgi:hypothetical protein|uniref:Inhibitor of sigma-G Gin n=1 Tax=Clostridium thermopalmarium DSM 5974 TaxID=1121340 RepID=A0A2T0APE6_9CLOT|nr:hypothetical protein [Clostridium thermopalmarium]PRR70887.1 hypothetical protein CPAL_19770 [Clostridium thermopalmarium DSM 5974]PVZ28811.1 hypothetical protein LX19_00115 [Clostridium thermopalmarium DSM 5974]
MNNIPDCCYEYRYESEMAKVVDTCSECGCNIYEGDEYYDINGLILCQNCLSDYKREAQAE